jgi:hypothetical protein
MRPLHPGSAGLGRDIRPPGVFTALCTVNNAA